MTKENTYLADQIEISEFRAKYDTEIKKLLASKQVLSRILKYTVREFADYEVEEIMDCIEGEPEINKVPIKPGKVKPEAIIGINTEDRVPNEGEITYDIRFHVITKHGKRMKMLFNIEAQRDSHPGYVLEHRGVFYAARMISSQLEQEFTIPHYDDIKKVYSIWICMESSRKLANTIVEYHMTEREIYGTVGKNDVCDLMSVIMVRLNPEEDNSLKENRLIGLLDILLSQKLSAAERKHMLSEEYGLEMTREMEGGLDEMCNLSEWFIDKTRKEIMAQVIEQGIEQGMAQGIEQGMAQGIEQGMAQGRAQGMERGILNTHFFYLKKGMTSVSEIAKEVDKPEREVEELYKQWAVESN